MANIFNSLDLDDQHFAALQGIVNSVMLSHPELQTEIAKLTSEAISRTLESLTSAKQQLCWMAEQNPMSWDGFDSSAAQYGLESASGSIADFIGELSFIKDQLDGLIQDEQDHWF